MKKIATFGLCFFLLPVVWGQSIPNKRLLVRYEGQKKGRYAVLSYRTDAEKQAFLNDSQVLFAEPDHTFQVSLLPNDPFLPEQWAIDKAGSNVTASSDIGAAEAWNLATDCDGIAGIIDTGIDYGHEDLKDNIWQNLAEDADGDGKVLEFINGSWQLDPGDLDGMDGDGNGYVDDLVGWDFVNDDNNPFDDNGHGTHVAGIIGAKGNNGLGITGVCWSAKLMALKAFDSRGAGSLSAILEALAYARSMGVSLTNNSWGGVSYSQFLYEEIEAAGADGQLFIAASGNQGRRNQYLDVYPAAYDLDNIISVGASNHQGELASFSNTSPTDVDLLAPGWRIFSTLPNGEYGLKTGTSMAAPFVSGAALLLQSYENNLDISQVRDRLFHTVQVSPALYNKCESGGILDLAAALLETDQIATSLNADFWAPLSGCIGSVLPFSNLSTTNGNSSLLQYEWYVDDQLLGTNKDFNWQPSQPGYFGIKLITRENALVDSTTRTIQITAPAFVDLGSDTTICASAYLLEASNPDFEYLWKRVLCGNQVPCAISYQYSSLDTIRFSENNGMTDGFDPHYVLTDPAGQMLDIASTTRFFPPDSGSFQVYGIYTSGGIPPGLSIGSPLSGVDLSGDACSGMTAPLDISVGKEVIGGTGLTYIVRESGTYILEVTDGCGNVFGDTIHITLNPGCVWPGDVDVDGQVTVLDFLSLGLAEGQSGPARPGASSSWSGQDATDWASTFDSLNQLSGPVNIKHADCDGDGIVDLDLDAAVIKANLGAFHRVEVEADSSAPALRVAHNGTTFASEDTAILDLSFSLEGPGGAEVTGVYGLAFQMYFSDPIVSSPDFSPMDEGWFSPARDMTAFWDGSQTTPGVQAFRDFRKTAAYALRSTNQTTPNGDGLIAGGPIIVTIDDLSDDNGVQGFSTLTISVDNLVIVDSIGQLRSVNLASELNTITIDIQWPTEFEATFPVEWLDFQVAQQGADALLQWTVAEEENIFQYQMERSVDGRVFEQIASLDPKPTTESWKLYAALDSNAAYLGHQNLYYRIREVDTDGAFSYSKVQQLRVERNKFALHLHAFPNPIEHTLQVEYAAQTSDQLLLRISNTLGQELHMQRLTEVRGRVHLDASEWPAGIYYLSLENAQQRKILKMVR